MGIVLDLLAYGALLLSELVFRSLPAPAAQGLADGVGTVWYLLDARRRDRARENLRVARGGGLRVADAEAVVRGCFRHLVRVPLELLLFPRYLRRARDVRRYCRYEGDWAALRSDMLTGRGGLIVGGHLGSWELPVWGLRFLPVPARVVARPLDNRWIERRALRARGGPGTVIPKRGAVRGTLRAVRDGGWVAVMADQNAGRGGVFVPFFGLPASTHATPMVIASRARVPVYVGACLRRPDRVLGYTMVVRRLPDPPAGLAEAERQAVALRDAMAVLESWVQRAPEQYNWVHRRWKTRPAGEAADQRLPAYARGRGDPG